MGSRLNFALLLLCIFQHVEVDSYPNSVPESPDVCSKMIPGHGPRPQQTPSPYKIVLNKQEVTGGNKLEITIIGKKGATFKGFYIQARDEDGKPIGTFLSPDEKESAAHNCFKQKNNAIHHKNNKPKKKITVYWKAPENYEGQVRVIATVLKDFEVFWTAVSAPEPVSITRSSSKIFFTSSALIEKEAEGSPNYEKTARILSYNPYSPITPFLPWDSKDDKNITSSEPLLSEENISKFQERQLFGQPSFDFHGGLYSPRIPASNGKATLPDGHRGTTGYQPKHHAQPPSFHFPPNVPGSYPYPPTSIQDKLQETPRKTDIKERIPFHLNSKGTFPPTYSQFGAPYPFLPYIPPKEHAQNPLYQNTLPFKFEESPHFNRLPHMSQSVYDKAGHYLINHHHLPKHVPDKISPLHYPPVPYPHYPPPIHKPAADPSYPNSGYFPKDILTKLTSYLPNIYNALTNNPLFNFNVDNTIESIWKPSKGVPLKQEASSSATPIKIDMPKYGYLLYNPVRRDPYFVIPAMNEEEFVANHLMRKDGPLPPTFT